MSEDRIMGRLYQRANPISSAIAHDTCTVIRNE